MAMAGVFALWASAITINHTLPTTRGPGVNHLPIHHGPVYSHGGKALGYIFPLSFQIYN